MTGVRVLAVLLAGACFAAGSSSARAADGTSLGPFVNVEADKTTSISPKCVRQGDRLACQFAAVQIASTDGKGACYLAVNSYPVSLTKAADGIWRGETPAPYCTAGITRYALDLDGTGAQAGAQLTISSCQAEPASVLTYKSKPDASFALACRHFSVVGFPDTARFLQAP